MKRKVKEEKPPPDIARLGIFKEEPYISINTRYAPLDTFIWNESAQSGRQFQTRTIGPKDGTSSGYFSKFHRAFEGEGLSDNLRMYRRDRRKTKDKYYAGEFVCSSPGKKIQGSGHYSGTFHGPVRAFRPNVRKEQKAVPKKNVKIQPPKRGCGYEILDCGINIYPRAMDPFEPKIRLTERLHDEDPMFYYFQKHPTYIHQNPYYINPALLTDRSKLRGISGKLNLARLATPAPFKMGKGKTIGGNKDGCFTKIAAYLNNTTRPLPYKRLDYPPIATMGAKISTFNSTIQTNVKKRVTPTTYRDVEGVMYVKPKPKLSCK